jgi:hypothetical protein
MGIFSRARDASVLITEETRASPSEEEMLARGPQQQPHLQQFSIPFIAGIRSGILEHAGPRAHRGAEREEGLHLRPSCGPSWRRTTTPS